MRLWIIGLIVLYFGLTASPAMAHPQHTFSSSRRISGRTDSSLVRSRSPIGDGDSGTSGNPHGAESDLDIANMFPGLSRIRRDARFE